MYRRVAYTVEKYLIFHKGVWECCVQAIKAAVAGGGAAWGFWRGLTPGGRLVFAVQSPVPDVRPCAPARSWPTLVYLRVSVHPSRASPAPLTCGGPTFLTT